MRTIKRTRDVRWLLDRVSSDVGYLLMLGPCGFGKMMMARRLAESMPEPDEQTQLEQAWIWTASVDVSRLARGSPARTVWPSVTLTWATVPGTAKPALRTSFGSSVPLISIIDSIVPRVTVAVGGFSAAVKGFATTTTTAATTTTTVTAMTTARRTAG